jgi:ubiquitin C-terminal hydrolase
MYIFDVDLTGSECQFTKEYQIVLCELFRKGVETPVDPSRLLCEFRRRFPAFASGQHDAHEVVTIVIDLLEKSLGCKLVQNIFNGTEVQETWWNVYKEGEIQRCSSHKESDFVSRIYWPTKNSTLQEVITEGANPQTIEGYTDDDGQTHTVAYTRTVVKRWPRVTGITFAMYEQKHTIQVPMEFEGKKLFGLILHSGICQGGHYVLVVRRHNIWYLKDDESVTEWKRGDVNSLPVYMAWYRE